jgi:hypothetical protein
MNVIPTQDVWFDDAATLAMGEAFDNACKSLQNFGSAVPAIIADLLIAGAKNGERDPARLYEQAIIIFAIEDTSMPLVSVGRDPPSQPTLPDFGLAGVNLASIQIACCSDSIVAFGKIADDFFTSIDPKLTSLPYTAKWETSRAMV